MRLTKEELQNVKDKYGVNELYSWSKVNTFMTSPFEFYLKYVLHKKEDLDNCAYAPMGGLSHQCIEDYYSNKIKFEDMINNFEDGWLTAIDLAGLMFDRNDEVKNENIKNKYKQNLEHFFKNHKVINRNIELERFLSAKIGDYVLQGYADAIIKDDDGCFNIIDWKTSSEYKGKVLDEHSGQLVVYCVALQQLGIPLNKIKCCFNFLKYVNVTVEQKNGKIKERSIERCKIGESLKASAKTWLKSLGYEDDLDEYLDNLVNTNSIECLPEDVKRKFIISDRYVYVDLNEKLINDWTSKIIATIKDIELRQEDYKETKNIKIWWDTEESLKEQSYYFSTLCGYSRKLHKPYDEYCKKIEEQKNGGVFGDMFGSNTFGNTNNDSNNIGSDNEVTEDVLSWLDNIEL